MLETRKPWYSCRFGMKRQPTSGCFCGYMFEILPLNWKNAQKVLLETNMYIKNMICNICIYITLSMRSSCVRVLLTFSCGHVLVASCSWAIILKEHSPTFCMFLLSLGIYRWTMWFSFTNMLNLFWCLTFASVSICMIFSARWHHRRNP
jgi:hypothetical protein